MNIFMVEALFFSLLSTFVEKSNIFERSWKVFRVLVREIVIEINGH